MGTAEDETAATEAFTAAYDAYMEALEEHFRAFHDGLERGHFVSLSDHVRALQDTFIEADRDYWRVMSSRPGEPAPPRAERAADHP